MLRRCHHLRHCTPHRTCSQQRIGSLADFVRYPGMICTNQSSYPPYFRICHPSNRYKSRSKMHPKRSRIFQRRNSGIQFPRKPRLHRNTYQRHNQHKEEVAPVPVRYLPAPQLVAFAVVAPLAVEYFPAPQLIQVLDAVAPVPVKNLPANICQTHNWCKLLR